MKQFLTLPKSRSFSVRSATLDKPLHVPDDRWRPHPQPRRACHHPELLQTHAHTCHLLPRCRGQAQMEVAGHARKDPGPTARTRLKALACAVLVVVCLWALQVARVHCSTEHGWLSRAAGGSAMLPRPDSSKRSSAGLGSSLTGQARLMQQDMLPPCSTSFQSRAEHG